MWCLVAAALHVRIAHKVGHLTLVCDTWGFCCSVRVVVWGLAQTRIPVLPVALPLSNAIRGIGNLLH